MNYPPEIGSDTAKSKQQIIPCQYMPLFRAKLPRIASEKLRR